MRIHLLLAAATALISCGPTVETYLKKNQYHKATTFCGSQDRDSQKACYAKVGDAYLEKGDLDRAAKYLDLAGAREKVNTIYLKIAGRFEADGENDSALEYLKKAGAKDRIRLIYLKIGRASRARGDVSNALHFFGLAGAEAEIKATYKAMGDKLFAEKRYKRSLEWYRKAGAPTKHVYLRLAQRMMELKAYFQAGPYFELAGKRPGDFYPIIARACLGGEQYPNAVYFFEKSGLPKASYLQEVVNFALSRRKYNQAHFHLLKMGRTQIQASWHTAVAAENQGDLMLAGAFFMRAQNPGRSVAAYLNVLGSSDNRYTARHHEARSRLLELAGPNTAQAFTTVSTTKDLKPLVELLRRKATGAPYRVVIFDLGWTGILGKAALNTATSIPLPRLTPRAFLRVLGRRRGFTVQDRVLDAQKTQVEGRVMRSVDQVALKAAKSSAPEEILIQWRTAHKELPASPNHIGVQITMHLTVTVPALKLVAFYSFSAKHSERISAPKKKEKKFKKEKKLARKLVYMKLREKLKNTQEKVRSFLKEANLR